MGFKSNKGEGLGDKAGPDPMTAAKPKVTRNAVVMMIGVLNETHKTNA